MFSTGQRVLRSSGLHEGGERGNLRTDAVPALLAGTYRHHVPGDQHERHNVLGTAPHRRQVRKAFVQILYIDIYPYRYCKFIVRPSVSMYSSRNVL